jgi:asparagine synthetase B (glutamine-hydrolysing)
MSEVRVLQDLDASFAWDGTRLCRDADLAPGRPVPEWLRGAVGSAQASPEGGAGGGGWRLVRDPLGIDKLFWAREEDGTLTIASRPARLLGGGRSLDEVSAIPRGRVLDLVPGRPDPIEHVLPLEPPPPIGGIEEAGGAIRAALDGYLAALAGAHPESQAYVCLSGGLDSSGIAALVRQHFPGAVAVSFDLARGEETSEDRFAAERVARELDMPLLCATVSERELLGHLDTVLVEGIDWRDFNVHAGLVNAALAEAIAAAGPSQEALVFTGDLANEFLVDYHPERYRGSTYYELPRLSPRALRSSLVRGLDTSHREVGVFEAWGLPMVQPYAVAVDAYLSLAEDFLRLPDRKERLCRAIFGEAIPAFVYSRPKARAQLGGGGGGVLAACLDQGVDAAFLKRRFAQLHGVSDPGELDRFIRAGRYRSASPSLTGKAHEPA